MKISRISHGGGAFPVRRFAFPVLCSLLLGSGLSSASAQAQNGALPPVNGTAVNGAPVNGTAVNGTATSLGLPGFKILLLSFDELPAPDATGKIIPLPAPPAAALPPITNEPEPDAPAAIPPAAITPARASVPLGGAFWSILAAKPPKTDKDADLFRLEPDRGLRPSKNVPPLELPVAAPRPELGGEAGRAAPPGRAQNTAFPLRRALLAQGWPDVLAVSPDSTAIARAMGERRLTSRTMDALKTALAQLAAPGTLPSPEATSAATVAASRIGQALGYRAVIALYVAPPTTRDGFQNAGFSLFLADSQRETGEPILFDEKGVDDNALRESGASTAAALLDKDLRVWSDVPASQRAALAQKHLVLARTSLASNDKITAQDELSQVVALDSTRSEAFVLLGDLLSETDAVGAATAYRRAVELNQQDAITWSKISIAYANSTPPDWPRALEAGNRALNANYDSSALRVAMATSQFGRADLFRQAQRIERAEDAEVEARKHLDRALALAPDDPSAVRLLAEQLLKGRRFDEALQTLDRIAPRYPQDLEIQTQYASALANRAGREEDAFIAYARVWKLSNQGQVEVDAMTYRALAQGFDIRIYNLGKTALQLASGVATAAVPREEALLQFTRLKEDMDAAQNAINVLRAPSSVTQSISTARVFAADLMTQSLDEQQMYLETGQEIHRVRGAQFNSQAVARLNAARLTR